MSVFMNKDDFVSGEELQSPGPYKRSQDDLAVYSFLHPSFNWLHHPEEWNVQDPNGELEGSQGTATVSDLGNNLTIRPPAKKDFWSKTFYTPSLKKSDASAYLHAVPLDSEATICVDFQFTPVSQFDQAGLLVYIDEDHWMKCGIEFCDGNCKLSVVVCNEYSDWSTQPWPTCSARLKIHKVLEADSVVVEAAALDSSDFQFVRIAHLSSKSGTGWQVGPFAACPIAQKGCMARFTDFSIGQKEDATHSSVL